MEKPAPEWNGTTETARKQPTFPDSTTGFSQNDVGGTSAERGLYSYRTGTSVDDGARKPNNWLDQLHSGKLGTGGRV